MSKLEIANYSSDGPTLRVRLKCSCGGRRILKTKINNEIHYQCAECKVTASLRRLKDEATTYWKGRIWEIECEEKEKPAAAISVKYGAMLEARPNRYVAPFCTLNGHCVEIGPEGLLFTARDFKKSYFQEISTNNRFATVHFTPIVRGLPPDLRGTIVEIKFRDDELPVARLRVTFQGLSEEEQRLVTSHVEDIRGRITEWSME